MPVLIVSPNGKITRKQSIPAAVASGDIANSILLVTSNQTINEDTTIPANVELQITNNAVVTINAPYSLWVLGEFTHPYRTCFVGSTYLPNGGNNGNQGMVFGSTDISGGLTATSVTAFLKEKQNANIASATNVDLSSLTGNYALVTGTNPISSFIGDVQAGVRVVLEFQSSLVLVYGATTLVLPTSSSITTEAGDVATFISMGSDKWKCVDYLRATGLSLSNTDTDVNIQNGSLEVVSNNIPVNWTWKPYLNGASSINTSAAHGSKAFSITSTSGTNNGGGALISDYIMCSELMPQFLSFTHWVTSLAYGMMNGVKARFFKSTIPSTVTFADSGDLVTCNSHGYDNGDPIQFSSITSTTGVSINTTYYVINKTLNTFQLCTSQTGTTAVVLTTDGGGVISTAYQVKNSIAASVTFTNGTPGSVTLTNHGFYNGAIIRFSSIVTTTGISANTNYAVVVTGTNTFTLQSVDSNNAPSSVPLAFTSGTGVIADYANLLSYTPSYSVTFQNTGDTVTLNSHGLANGTAVRFRSISVSNGLTEMMTYFVTSTATNTFQVATRPGGAAVAITADSTGILINEYSSSTPTLIISKLTPYAGAKFMKLDFIGGAVNNGTNVSNAYGTANYDNIELSSTLQQTTAYSYTTQLYAELSLNSTSFATTTAVFVRVPFINMPVTVGVQTQLKTGSALYPVDMCLNYNGTTGTSTSTSSTSYVAVSPSVSVTATSSHIIPINIQTREVTSGVLAYTQRTPTLPSLDVITVTPAISRGY